MQIEYVSAVRTRFRLERGEGGRGRRAWSGWGGREGGSGRKKLVTEFSRDITGRALLPPPSPSLLSSTAVGMVFSLSLSVFDFFFFLNFAIGLCETGVSCDV